MTIFMISRYFPHKTKYSIFSLLTDTTRIHDDDICLGRIDDFPQSCRHEDHMDLLRVSIVHLTAEGLDVEGFYLHLTNLFFIYNYTY